MYYKCEISSERTKIYFGSLKTRYNGGKTIPMIGLWL